MQVQPFTKPRYEDLYVVREFTNGDSDGLQAKHDGETIWEFYHELPWWVKDALLDAYARGLEDGLRINY